MNSTPSQQRWSKLNIYLHWLIVALVIVQYVDHEWMVKFWDGTQGEGQASQTAVTWGWVHIVGGSVILAAILVRLLDRFISGKPDHPVGVPTWSAALAKITHFLLYAVLIVMPSLGLVAWFTGDDSIAGYHTFLWTPLLILIALHILGALVQQFWFKTGVLKRMVP